MATYEAQEGQRERTGVCIFASTTISPNSRWIISKNQEAFFCFKRALTFFLDCLNNKRRTGPTTLSSLSQKTSEKGLFAFAPENNMQNHKLRYLPSANHWSFVLRRGLMTGLTGNAVRWGCKEGRAATGFIEFNQCICLCAHLLCQAWFIRMCRFIHHVFLFYMISVTWGAGSMSIHHETSRVSDVFPSCDQ